MTKALLVLLFIGVCFAGVVQWNEWEDLSIGSEKQWKLIGDANGHEQIDILIGLTLRNQNQFTSILMDVSDPQSTNYGWFYIGIMWNI